MVGATSSEGFLAAERRMPIADVHDCVIEPYWPLHNAATIELVGEARPAVTPAALKRAATNFTAW